MCEQITPQSIPTDSLLTTPNPSPDTVTFNSTCGIASNSALTSVLTVRLTPHSSLLGSDSQPVHLTNLEVELGLASRTTLVPVLKLPEQAEGQLTLGTGSLLITDPPPDPSSTTLSVRLGTSINSALTSVALVILTSHSDLPGGPTSTSHPVHLPNSEPPAGSAFNLTFSPLKNL